MQHNRLQPPVHTLTQFYPEQATTHGVSLQQENHNVHILPAPAVPYTHVSQHETENKQRRTLTWSDFWQFFRFCLVGSLNAVIDFVVLDLLLWKYPTANNEKILLYNSLAVLLASTNSFFCNKYWTFQQRQAITSQEVGRFIVVALATTIMNDVLMFLLSSFFPNIMNSTLIGANVLKLGAIIGTMSISFFGMRLWVFLKRGSTSSKQITNNVRTTSLVAAIVHISDMPTVRVSVPRVMKTLIIIPTYNERENLPLLLHDIFAYAPNTDVLIVDDNSPDGTGQIADAMCEKNSHIHVLHRPGKLGLGTAYIAGFKYAITHGYDVAFEMDADFSHDPRYLPDFLKEIINADVVIGSRYIPGGSTPNWSTTRRLISGGGNAFARFMLNIPVHDCTGGYRCYRSHVLQALDLDSIQSRGYAFQVELTYRVLRQGFKIAETPITFMDRRLGTSKMSKKIVVEAFTYVLKTRFSKSTSRSAIQIRSEERQSSRVVQKPFERQITLFPIHSENSYSMQATPFPQVPFPQVPFPQVPFPPQPDYSVISQSLPPAWAPVAPIHHKKTSVVLVEAGRETGRVFEISKASLSIGRINENDISLDDPAISRLHASILSEHGENYVLIDESSANGTKVNGKMVEKYQRYLLQDGDKIQLGATVLIFAKHQSETNHVHSY